MEKFKMSNRQLKNTVKYAFASESLLQRKGQGQKKQNLTLETIHFMKSLMNMVVNSLK